MCAIAGIFIKKRAGNPLNMTTGEALTAILDATLHRGPDSTGWALYHPPLEDRLRLRLFLDAGTSAPTAVSRLRNLMAANGVTVLAEEMTGCTYGTTVSFGGDIPELTRALQQSARLVSIGTSLDIIKDVGQPEALAKQYDIASFDGDHGIAHIRLATESGVRPDTAHPFWACGFADVATVHNGQITNYWIMRRRLERKGMRFQTENDTELIAVYLAYQMSRGMLLEEALEHSLEDLDGTFSYLVATRDAIGYAKDKLAAKPMVKYEDEHLIAISSEEVGLNRLYPGRSLETSEPPPQTFGLWSRGT